MATRWAEGWRAAAIGSALGALLLVAGGCSCKKEPTGAQPPKGPSAKAAQEAPAVDEFADEPTKHQNQAPLGPSGPPDISDNPAFFAAQDHPPVGAAAKEIDGFLRPVLVQVFRDARLVSEADLPRYGEGASNDRVKYVVRMLISEGDIDILDKALQAANFHTSPRLGRVPTYFRSLGFAAMSRFKTRSGHSYHLCIVMDMRDQNICAFVYIPDPKADRM